MTFDEICSLVQSRKQQRPAGSETASLFAQGIDAIGKKLVEEAAESWMASKYEEPERLAEELSQVLYYVACLMAAQGLRPKDVYQHL